MRCVAAIAVSLVWGLCAAAIAAPVAVPNGSFESPTTDFVNINIDNWQKNEKPAWYVEGGGYLWSQLTGLFMNTPAGSDDHIDNMDGDQAMWLFAVPEVELFQDHESTDWAHAAPLHAFDAVYQVGHVYQLVVGVIGGGGGMPDGATLELSLYYREAGGAPVTIASTVVTQGIEQFPSTNHFVDQVVSLPAVRAGDAWAGRHIGIRFRSTVTPALQGGYWDIDHVRLVGIPQPALTLTREGPAVRASWTTVTGFHYQLEGCTDPAGEPEAAGWAGVGAARPGTGLPMSEAMPVAAAPRRFFRVKVLFPPGQ